MAINNSVKMMISEGKAKLIAPKNVFYNPVQEFNRDLSVLVLRTYLKYNVWHHRSEEKHIKARGGLKVLDALSASGLRSIRYAKELGQSGSIVKQIVANDLSSSAVEQIEKNLALNNVEDRVTSSLSDAATLLHSSSTTFENRFHVIDLDPFGTGAQFFDAAVRAIGEAGLLMVTCTDTAVLCGNASESCFARYGSMSLRADFCHEAALRIILKSLESHAAVYGRYIKPLLCISVDFYVRLFVQVFSQQSETKKSASKLSQLYLCKDCKTFELNPLGSIQIKEDTKQAKSKNDAVKYKYKPGEVLIGNECTICKGSYNLGGPIWSEAIHDAQFLEYLKKELSLEETKNEFQTFRRMEGIIYLCSEELNVPLFRCIDTMSSTLRIRMPRARDLLSALANAGYEISGTHANRLGFKTNAPSSVVWDIFCQVAKQQGSETDDPLAQRIISRHSSTHIYDFTLNRKVDTESKKLLRFQMNPEREWGPKPRPSGKSDANDDDMAKHSETDTTQGDAPISLGTDDNLNNQADNSKKRKLSDV